MDEINYHNHKTALSEDLVSTSDEMQRPEAP